MAIPYLPIAMLYLPLKVCHTLTLLKFIDGFSIPAKENIINIEGIPSFSKNTNVSNQQPMSSRHLKIIPTVRYVKCFRLECYSNLQLIYS